jgi:hypothetical protein
MYCTGCLKNDIDILNELNTPDFNIFEKPKSHDALGSLVVLHECFVGFLGALGGFMEKKFS